MTEADRQVGRRIRERRLRLGLAQGALARAAGISGSYLNLIEHGKRRIGGARLQALARALGVEAAALANGPGPALAETLTAAARAVRAADGDGTRGVAGTDRPRTSVPADAAQARPDGFHGADGPISRPELPRDPTTPPRANSARGTGPSHGANALRHPSAKAGTIPQTDSTGGTDTAGASGGPHASSRARSRPEITSEAGTARGADAAGRTGASDATELSGRPNTTPGAVMGGDPDLGGPDGAPVGPRAAKASAKSDQVPAGDHASVPRAAGATETPAAAAAPVRPPRAVDTRGMPTSPAVPSRGTPGGTSDDAGRPTPLRGDAAAEIEAIDELAARFPGWTGVLVAQAERIAALEAEVAGLRDRMATDPVLSGALHEVLSGVTAIRSTSEILVADPNIEPAWRGRFHRNLREEAERLSRRARAIAGHFDRLAGEAGPGADAAVDRAFQAAGYFFPAIEAEGAAGIDAALASMGLDGAAARLAGARLAAYAEDAGRLPLGDLWLAAVAGEFRPEALIAPASGDAALALRRLGALPDRPDGLAALAALVEPAGMATPPPTGLAVCDGAGTLLARRWLADLTAPLYGAGCALWPLYQVIGRPMALERTAVEMPGGARLTAWAAYAAQAGEAGAQIGRAVMLIRPEAHGPARPVGPACARCPRQGCGARVGPAPPPPS